MSRFRPFELIEKPFCNSPPLLFRETTIVVPKTLTFPSFIEEDLDVGFALDLFLPFEASDAVTDLVRIDRTPSFACKRVPRVDRQQLGAESCLQSLCDRIAELESRFDRFASGRSGGGCGGDRKYTWTTEIKGPEKNGFERKYKWVVEMIEEEKKKTKMIKGGSAIAKNVIRGKGEESGSSRKYALVEESDGSGKKEKKKEKEKKKKGGEVRIVEIEEPAEQRAVVLRQAFAKRFGAVQNAKGKKKELSPQDAALLIQISFRAYLIRRSKALRALRELAVARSKVKEIRAQFNNFAYRRRVAHDEEELQKFTEKIIVLLLTVDAIEGVDLMVRSAKRSMVDELEAMLDVVDPQPARRSLSVKRRTFDMPDGVIRKEIAEGVAQVVHMLDEAENSSSTFEAYL